MNKLTWPTVGLIAVLGTVAVVLAAVAHWDAGAILGVVGILAGIGGGAAVGGAVAGKVEDVHAETAAQNEVLAKIDHQTNGLSEAERQDIAVRAVAEAKRQGLV
ncbi:hypothetical protein [Actinoplanes subtropicus]|uniref:hypothetical protein n=1 Tax=Actinoplanes subtropicus TaxID=543632 RepID=UPI0004C41AE4|nr:hypothetical protein [Actinoplanes subtropicus]